MRFYSIPIFMFLVIIFCCTGCVHQREHDTRRIWADWNTLGAHAIFLEQKDHKPYHSARVGNFRWSYGKNPGHQYFFPYYTSAANLNTVDSDPFFNSTLPLAEPETGTLPPSSNNMMESLPILPKPESPLKSDPAPPSPMKKLPTPPLPNL